MQAQHTREAAEGQRLGPREAARRRRAHTLVTSAPCVTPSVGYFDPIAERWWPPFASKRKRAAKPGPTIVIYGLRLADEQRYVYVGQTEDLGRRTRDHRQRARDRASHTGSGGKLYTWMREVGIERVVFDVLDRVPERLAELAEQMWIARLWTRDLLNTNSPGRASRGWRHSRGTRTRQRARAVDRSVLAQLEAAGVSGSGSGMLAAESDRQRKASLRRLQAEGSVVRVGRGVYALARLAMPVGEQSARPAEAVDGETAKKTRGPNENRANAVAAPSTAPRTPGPGAASLQPVALLKIADVVAALQSGELHRNELKRRSGTNGGVANAIAIGLVVHAGSVGQRVYWRLADDWREIAMRCGVVRSGA